MPRPEPEILTELRGALSASWSAETSYRAIAEHGNPALGQCYPTSRVVQHFVPEVVIFEGTVWTGTREERHYWNGLRHGTEWHHIDLTWQQFPEGSSIRSFEVYDRPQQDDGPEALRRCALLLSRVKAHFQHLEEMKSHRKNVTLSNQVPR